MRERAEVFAKPAMERWDGVGAPVTSWWVLVIIATSPRVTKKSARIICEAGRWPSHTVPCVAQASAIRWT
jgi:hypothetical protein